MSGAPTPQIVEPGTAALLAEAAERFATPCYVTDLRVLDRRAGELGAEFPDPWIRQYSLKANPLPAVVARLAESGFGASVVSSATIWFRYGRCPAGPIGAVSSISDSASTREAGRAASAARARARWAARSPRLDPSAM